MGCSKDPSISNYGAFTLPPVSIGIQAHSHNIEHLTLSRSISIGDATLDVSVQNLEILWMDNRLGQRRCTANAHRGRKARNVENVS